MYNLARYLTIPLNYTRGSFLIQQVASDLPRHVRRRDYCVFPRYIISIEEVRTSIYT